MPSQKPKTARAVEINIGTQNAFMKKLASLSRAFSHYVAGEIFLMLSDRGVLAQDESLSNPRDKEKREKLEKLQFKIVEFYKLNPKKVHEDIDEYVNKNLSVWVDKVSKETSVVVNWFVSNLTKDVSAAQRKSLLAAGMPPDYLKERWTVPIVRGQYISPMAAERLPEIIETATNLITKMYASDVQRLQEVIAEGLLNGEDIKTIQKTLESFEGFDLARAKRVALDQSIKVNQAIQRENARSLGISEAIWIHVPGKYTSRHTHIEMNGKRFDLNDGLFDKDVQKNVLPGELPYCRCICRMILPNYFMKSK